MSLINDALKRATEAQNKTEQMPPPTLKLRAVEPREAAPKNSSWILPSLITGTVLITAFFIWQMTKKEPTQQKSATPAANATTLKVHAREQEDSGVAISGAKMPNLPESQKVAVVAVSGTTIQETTKAQGTNSALVDSASSKPAGPKLQAIVFIPGSPSAMISGNTVFVGEKVGEWKVVAITKDSATLVGSGQTKVLRLGQ